MNDAELKEEFPVYLPEAPLFNVSVYRKMPVLVLHSAGEK
jgi:hypothetical protein